MDVERAIAQRATACRYRDQALLRLMVGAFLGAYFLQFDLSNHPLYLLFALYSLFALSIAERTGDAIRPVWTLASLSLDGAFAFIGLHITQAHGLFLFILLVQIARDYGARFGLCYLWACVVVAVTGIGVLWLFDPYWSQQPYTCLAAALAVPLLTLHFHRPPGQGISRGENDGESRRARQDVLFAFAHDVRAYLQILKTTIEFSKQCLTEQPSRIGSNLDSIDRITESLARLATSELDRRGRGLVGDVAQRPATAMPGIELGTWLAGIVDRHRAAIDMIDCRLIIRFLPSVPARLRVQAEALDRALMNILSNATRYATRGTIEVEVGARGRGRDRRLVIRVENTVARQPREQDLGGLVSQAGYSGAHAGLRLTASLLRDLGGSASFIENAAGNFVSTISLPCQETCEWWSEPVVGELAYVGFDREWFAACAAQRDRIALRSTAFGCVDYLEFLARAPTACAQGLVVLAGDRCNAGRVLTSLHATSIRVLLLGEYIALPGRARISVWAHAGRGPSLLSALTPALAFLRSCGNRPETPATLHSSPRVQLVGLSVLLLDDSDAYLARQALLFRAAGAQVRTARTCAEAFACLGRDKPDVIFADLFLGTETLDTLLGVIAHGARTTPQPRLVIVTGATPEETSARLGGYRYDAMFTKPVSFCELASYLLSGEATASRNAFDQSDTGGESASVVDWQIGIVQELLEAGAAPEVVATWMERMAAELRTAACGLRNSCDTNSRDYARRWVHVTLGLADACGVIALGQSAGRLLNLLDGMDVADRARELLDLAVMAEAITENIDAMRKSALSGS